MLINQATGVRGEIKVSGRSAATLGKWEWSRDKAKGAWSLTATALELDEWLMRYVDQAVIYLDTAKRRLVFRDAEITVGGKVINATGTGVPEREWK
jgi:hypothetical protein